MDKFLTHLFGGMYSYSLTGSRFRHTYDSL